MLQLESQLKLVLCIEFMLGHLYRELPPANWLDSVCRTSLPLVVTNLFEFGLSPLVWK